MRARPFFASFLLATAAAAQQPSVPSASLTIYNQNFAVARTPVQLDLHPGLNRVATTQVTSQIEPDSVVLLDPSGKHGFQILEQNYDAGIVNQEWMLRQYEGKTIGFEVPSAAPDQAPHIIQGKIIRAGSDGAQPLIQVNGQLEFRLPGTPLFPAAADLPLEPTLHWQIQSSEAQKLAAELVYITNGLTWGATYSVVALGEATEHPQSVSEEKADLTGWVTIHNTSGTDFPDARIQLMAGDVAKIASNGETPEPRMMAMMFARKAEVPVTQTPFSDFHLYDLHRAVTLLNGQTKQVEFLTASGITVNRIYRYDGSPQIFQPIYSDNGVNINRDFGIDNNTKVEIVQQFKNTQANHLGVPLPAGRIRIYRRDSDGHLEFVGESAIDHTPAEDTVSVTTGSAFDVKASRRQTDFRVNQAGHELNESFEIKLTNQKSEPVTVQVIEHMNRGNNWQITQKSAACTKIDSHTVRFAIPVPAKGTATVTYSVQYTW